MLADKYLESGLFYKDCLLKNQRKLAEIFISNCFGLKNGQMKITRYYLICFSLRFILQDIFLQWYVCVFTRIGKAHLKKYTRSGHFPQTVSKLLLESTAIKRKLEMWVKKQKKRLEKSFSIQWSNYDFALITYDLTK